MYEDTLFDKITLLKEIDNLKLVQNKAKKKINLDCFINKLIIYTLYNGKTLNIFGLKKYKLFTRYL
jgi:hypothetical protein